MKTSKGMRLRVSLLGIGTVGLVTGAVFAKHGHEVVVTDKNKERVAILNKGKTPFYEPGLDEFIGDLVSKGLLRGSSNNYESIIDTDITFICVGTPSNPDGSMNLDYIEKASIDIGKALKDKRGYHVVISKSTVVPGTTEDVILKRIEEHSSKKRGADFGACSNPEFLMEGNALSGALNPDRIVIGELDEKSGNTLMMLYSNFAKRVPRLRVDIRTAEMIKYASNSLLATKISFANEMANICEQFGIDVYKVMDGVGLDFRINPRFLRAGVGFGGLCFPKDVKAIASAARLRGLSTPLLNSVIAINEHQPIHAVELAESAVGDLGNKNVCILGLSFKPDTDDVRETRALPISMELIKKGSSVTGYDPRGMKNFKELLEEMEKKHGVTLPMNFAGSAREALRNMDVVIIQNEWEEFRNLSPSDFKTLMRSPVVIDGRRIYDPEPFIREGVIYRGIGWKGNS